MDPSAQLASTLASLMDQMIAQQRRKVFQTAQRLRPNITEDDVMDPHSIPEISHHPGFSYEDGLLAGLVAARVAIEREIDSHARGKS